jgi:hypothetical protein
MKLIVNCIHCRDSAQAEEERDFIINIELRDDARYEFTCLKGHKSIIYLQNLKFELLFQLGAMALSDGYTREAVASIAAALERFYEFYVRVIAFKYGISIEQVEKFWKSVKKQSERQFGAFLFCYLIENKQAPAFVDNTYNDKVRFRNNVIHNGEIPPYDKAIEYAEYVFDIIVNLSKQLRQSSQDAVNEVVEQFAPRTSDDGKKIESNTILNIPTIIRVSGIYGSLSASAINSGSFREGFETLKGKHGFLIK